MKTPKKPEPRLRYDLLDDFPGCCGIDVPAGLSVEEPEPQFDDPQDSNKITGYEFWNEVISSKGRKIQLCTTIPSQKLDDAMRKAGFTALIDFPSNHGNGRYRITLWMRGKGIRVKVPNSPTFSKRFKTS